MRNVCQFDLIRSPPIPKLVSPISPYEGAYATTLAEDSDGAVDSDVDSQYPILDPIYNPVYDPASVRRGLNFHLRSNWTQIYITDCSVVPPTFECRFEAKGRTYMYRILCAPGLSLTPVSHVTQSTFETKRAWIRRSLLDVDAMRRAATYFLGEQDFSSLHRRKEDHQTSVRHVRAIEIVTKQNVYRSPFEDSSSSLSCSDEEVHIFIKADSFVQRMVRNIVGILVRVGEGRLKPEQIPDILALKDRQKVEIDPAPPMGLYLVDVHYD